MRPERGRKKKLIVAFHFQFANQAAWKCDSCRKQGLETRRRCSWTPGALSQPERLVWARGGVRLTTCPKPLLTPESEEWLERWQVGRTFGFGDILSLPARAVDAFCLLETQLATERNNDSNGNNRFE